ncbi:MAG: hypothetical protein ACRDJ4_16455 [Actinomycetota bacterium]
MEPEGTRNGSAPIEPAESAPPDAAPSESQASSERNAPDAIEEAIPTFEAAVEGTVSLHDARVVFASLQNVVPWGLYAWESIEDPAEQMLYDAVEAFKMTLDALEAQQQALARNYVKVARIKLQKARGAE